MARTRERPYGGAPASSQIPLIQSRAYGGASGSSQTPTAQTKPGTNNRSTLLDWDGIHDSPDDAWAQIKKHTYRVFMGHYEDTYLADLSTSKRRKFKKEYWDYIFTLCYALQHIITRIDNLVFHIKRIFQNSDTPDIILRIFQGMVDIAWFRFSALTQVWECLKHTPFDERPLNEAFNRYVFDLELPDENDLRDFLDIWDPRMVLGCWILYTKDFVREACQILTYNPWAPSDTTNKPVKNPDGKKLARELRTSLLKIVPSWREKWNSDKFDEEIDFPSVIIGKAARSDNMNGPGPSS